MITLKSKDKTINIEGTKATIIMKNCTNTVDIRKDLWWSSVEGFINNRIAKGFVKI